MGQRLRPATFRALEKTNPTPRRHPSSIPDKPNSPRHAGRFHLRAWGGFSDKANSGRPRSEDSQTKPIRAQVTLGRFPDKANPVGRLGRIFRQSQFGRFPDKANPVGRLGRIFRQSQSQLAPAKVEAMIESITGQSRRGSSPRAESRSDDRPAGSPIHSSRSEAGKHTIPENGLRSSVSMLSSWHDSSPDPHGLVERGFVMASRGSNATPLLVIATDREPNADEGNPNSPHPRHAA